MVCLCHKVRFGLHAVTRSCCRSLMLSRTATQAQDRQRSEHVNRQACMMHIKRLCACKHQHAERAGGPHGSPSLTPPSLLRSANKVWPCSPAVSAGCLAGAPVAPPAGPMLRTPASAGPSDLGSRAARGCSRLRCSACCFSGCCCCCCGWGWAVVRHPADSGL